jgi:hypothetical protein
MAGRNDDDDDDDDVFTMPQPAPDRPMVNSIHQQKLLPQLSERIWDHTFDAFGSEDSGVFHKLVFEHSEGTNIIYLFIYLPVLADIEIDIDSFSCLLPLADAQKLLIAFNGLVCKSGGPPMVFKRTKNGPGNELATFHNNATELVNGPLNAFF